MSNEVALTSSIDVFIRRRLITEVLDTIKSGKEATVYRCRAHPETGRRFAAVKIHRQCAQRAFKNDAIYQHGRVILDQRAARAYAAGSRFGRRAQTKLWTSAEYDTLHLLRHAGAAVPEPLARDGTALLMEWIGGDDPAPTLQRVRFDPETAERCVDALLAQIALWLAHDRVHGDLSPFNILWHDEAPVVIDFPQAVDPRTNANARELLRRDLANLGLWSIRYGIELDAEALVADLWAQWLAGARR